MSSQWPKTTHQAYPWGCENNKATGVKGFPNYCSLFWIFLLPWGQELFSFHLPVQSKYWRNACRINEWSLDKWKIYLTDEVFIVSCGQQDCPSHQLKVSFTFKFHLHIIYSIVSQQTFTEHLLSVTLLQLQSVNWFVMNSWLSSGASSCFFPSLCNTQLSPLSGFSSWSQNWPLGNQELFLLISSHPVPQKVSGS